MRSTLARWLIALLVVVLHPAPAEAIGLKLTIKLFPPHRVVVVRPSTMPSHVLLIGSPPRRLERSLSAAGHDVERAATAAAATRTSYPVVSVASDAQAAEARARFVGATVVVRSGWLDVDLLDVEIAVIHRRARIDALRELVATIRARPPFVAAPAPDSAPSGGAAAIVAVLAALGLAVLTRARVADAADS